MKRLITLVLILSLNHALAQEQVLLTPVKDIDFESLAKATGATDCQSQAIMKQLSQGDKINAFVLDASTVTTNGRPLNLKSYSTVTVNNEEFYVSEVKGSAPAAYGLQDPQTKGSDTDNLKMTDNLKVKYTNQNFEATISPKGKVELTFKLP